MYRDSWMDAVTSEDIVYVDAEVTQITAEEFDALSEAIQNEEEIVIEEPEEEIVEEEVIPETETPTVAFVKAAKIKEMSVACNSVITNGFDVVLSDGNSHHFSLTIQDQINLISLSGMIATGETYVPYHADDEPCAMFSAEDINLIVSTATSFKTYHTSYFNSLKTYINSLRSINTVSAIEYGTEIPERYQSDVLKALIAAQQ